MPIDVTYLCQLAALLHRTVRHTLSPAQHNNTKVYATSALSGFEAVEVFLGFFEVVDCGRLCCCAVRTPFLVFLLALRAPCRASCIGVDVEGLNLVDAMQVHATLCEQVFAPWFIACKLLAALVIQRRHAIIEVCHQCACGVVAEDLKAAEESVIDPLAVLKVDTVFSHLNLAQLLTEPDGEEHGISIDFHSPIHARPEALILDCFPGLDEHVRVDPCAGLFPLGKVEVTVNVVDLNSVKLVGAQPCFHITVNPPSLTSKDACAEEKLGPQQIQLVRFFGAASVRRIEGPAKERVRRICNVGPFGWNHWYGMVEAGAILALHALLHAFGISCMHLIALVACNLAALLGDAIYSGLCALLTWRCHSDLTELEWGHLLGESMGRPRVRTCGEAYEQERAGCPYCQCNFAPPLGSGS